MTIETHSVTDELAAFASGLAWSDLPPTTQNAARSTFANVVGLAVGASRNPAVERALRALTAFGLTGDVSILGRRERLSATSAALVTGIAMHVEDFDDTHLRTVLHPGAPIVPAALAVGEVVGGSGEDVLTAVVAGVEVASRVGNGLGVAHFDRGWHVTGTVGHLGAAVAAGRLLRLTPEQMRHTLALAATQAAGHTEQLGSMTKPLHPGKAAADGVEAAQLAARGFTGPEGSIEGRRGLAALMTSDADYEEMLRALGSAWETEKNAFKPYSCGIVSHPVIDAAIALRERGVVADTIAAVEVTAHPVVLDVMGVKEPDSGLRSKFSVYHCFAVGLLDGAAGPKQYSDERALAEEVVALRRKVNVVVDRTVAKDACSVRVLLDDGTTQEVEVEHATGSIDRPMTLEQLRAKFELVVEPVLGAATARLWDLAVGLDSEDSLAGLLATSVPSA
ncbi:MAG: MmgE/PrpD family protein [Propionibacteriales bacterium]|nr:MmgE/PrpD family protein [Propionibacteriales bacterium]